MSIKIGDTVSVNFNGAQITLCYKAEVVYIPCATGDCWIFKDRGLVAPNKDYNDPHQ